MACVWRQGYGKDNEGSLFRLSKKKRVRKGETRLVECTYCFLEMGDEVVTLLLLLQTSKGHFGAGDILFRIFYRAVSSWGCQGEEWNGHRPR